MHNAGYPTRFSSHSMRLTSGSGILCIAVLLLLSACSTPRVAKYPVAGPSADRTEVLASEDWSFKGKMAVKSDQGNANLRVAWTQNNEKFDLILSGLLGQVIARVMGEEGAVTVTTAGRGQMVSEDAESLFYEIWGWQLPVSQMPYWVRGLAAPDLPHQADYDSRGFLQELQQLGWQVRYLRYEGQMPVRLELIRGEVKLLLVVKEWHLKGPVNGD
jgi:outer membrane lipoprotein LolB